MAIWKTRKGRSFSKSQGVLRCSKAVSAAFLLCTLSLASAEVTTQIKITPLFTMPLANQNFSRGLGANLTVEVQPVKLLCLTAEGEYMSLSKKADGLSPIQLISVNAGAGIRVPIGDRLILGADLLAGFYSASDSGSGTVTGITAGARVSAFYRLSPSLSAGIQGSPAHYAYMPQPLMTSVGAGPSLSLNLNQAFNTKANIRTNIVSLDPVFPVLYSWYNDNSFAQVEIFNDEQNTVDNVQVYFYLEQYMNQPKLCGTSKKIAKGESFTADLTAFFNERVLELNEKTDTKAKLIIEYTSLSKKMTKEVPVTIPVYHRNAMSWKDDRRAAAFVSSKDPSALWFSKYISSVVKDSFRSGINTNLQYAIGLFEAVNTFGLNYVIDPSSAYADNIGGESIDFLQFPYQTLMFRGGDCDDISILFCSLLEAVGIDTAFITIPGHIYMAFSTGLTEKEAREQFADPSLLIMHENTAWIPLEITLTKEGFDKAWRIGARQWNTAAAQNQAQLYPMKNSWELYRPISVPGAQAAITMPERTAITTSFSNSMDVWVEKEIRPQVIELTAKLAQNEDAEIQNRLGVLYAKHGMLCEAEEHFITASNKRYIPSYINLANIYFTKQDYKQALQWYSLVLNQEPVNTAALLGTARSLYEMDDFSNSDIFYSAVIKYDPALAQKYAYLGSFTETKGRSWSLADRLTYSLWITEGNYIPEAKKSSSEADYKTIARALGPSTTGLSAELSITQKTDGKITLASAQKNLIIARSQNTVKREDEEEPIETPNFTPGNSAVLAAKEQNTKIPEVKESESVPEPDNNQETIPEKTTPEETQMVAVLEPLPLVKEEDPPEPEDTIVEAEPEPEPESLPEPVQTAETESSAPEAKPLPAQAEPEAKLLPAQAEPEAKPLPAQAEPEAKPLVAQAEPEAKPLVVQAEPEAKPLPAQAEPEAKPLVEQAEAETKPLITQAEPEVKPSAVQTEQEEIPDVQEVQNTANTPDAELSMQQAEHKIIQEEKKNLPLIIISIIAGLGAAAAAAGALIGKIFNHKNPKV